MKSIRVIAVVLTFVGLVGCGGSKPKAVTPDGAIVNIQQAVMDNSPSQIFTAMPASYQSDINALVSDAASRMDEQVWTEVTGLFKQIVGLLKSKRDLILSSQMMASVPNKSDVEKNWDAGIGILQMLVNSDFTNLERLRKGDLVGILERDGAAIMKELTRLVETSESSAEAGEALAQLKAMRVSIVSQDADRAMVKVEVPGEPAEDIAMVKVEGVWIPQEMADGFSEAIAEARQNLAQIDFTSEEGKQKKTQLLMQIGAIKPIISQLEAAQTQEDLQNVIGGVMGMVMGGMMQ